MNREKITTWQAILLIISMILPSAILTVPNIVVSYARSDAWISVLLATASGILVAFISSTISLKYPGATIFQIAEKSLGRIFKHAMGLIFCILFSIGSVNILRQFSDFITNSVLQRTPSLVIEIVMILLAIYALYSGLEVFARVNTIIVMTSFIIFSFSTLFYFQEMKFDRLFPMFEAPINQIIMGAYAPVGWFSEVSVILILAPYLNNPGKARKAAILGVTLCGLSLTWTIIGTISIVGAHILPTYNYPAFTVFRMIEVAGFLERIDALFIAVWVGTMVMKLVVFMFSGFYCFCQTFKVREQVPFLFPYGILIITFCHISWTSQSEFNVYQFYSTVPYLIFNNISIPVLIFIADLIRNSKRGRRPS